MKKILALLAAIFMATSAHADSSPNDYLISVIYDTQYDAFGEFLPDPGANAIFAWDPTSTVGRSGVGGVGGFVYWTLGSNLGISSHVLSVLSAPTATKLTTSRTIGGVSFDGTSNINLTTSSSIQKGNGSGGFTAASAGSDYQSPISLTTTGTGSATFVSNTLNIPTNTPAARTFNQTTPTLNASGAQISSSQDSFVSCSVDITVQSLLLGNASGSVALRYADNSGMSTNLVSVISGQSITGGVLSLTNTNTVTLSGIIPAGKFRQITSTVAAGTATFANIKCQEVLL